MKRNVIAGALASLLVTVPGGLSAQAQTGKPAEPAMSAAEKGAVDAERALWETFKKQDWATFAKETDGMMSVDGSGINPNSQTSQMMDALKTLVLNSYELSDMHARTVAKHIVVLTYKVTFDETAAGKHVPSPVYALSVLHRKGGRWVAVAHSESNASDAK